MNKIYYTVTSAIALALLIAALLIVFVAAPVEATLGIGQKIFYFHVPCAYVTYLAWITCALASLAYLLKRQERFDMLAASAGELALVFALLLMVTGMLWAKKAWGVFWTWDPRLTSSLLLALIIVSYALLRYLGLGEAERRFAAALAILGTTIIPIIHISVQKWRGQHPAVISAQGGGLADGMVAPLIVSILAFTALFVVLLSARYGLEKNRRRLAALISDASLLDLDQERQ